MVNWGPVIFICFCCAAGSEMLTDSPLDRHVTELIGGEVEISERESATRGYRSGCSLP
jgi:hypothetical protein